MSVFSDSDRSPHVPNDRDIVVGGNSSPTPFSSRFPRVRFDSVLGSETEEPLQQDGTNLSQLSEFGNDGCERKDEAHGY